MIYTGTVKRWYTAKGFGFASIDESADEVLLHRHELVCTGPRSLEPGTRIAMQIEDRNGKAYAKMITTPEGQPLKGQVVEDHRHHPYKKKPP